MNYLKVSEVLLKYSKPSIFQTMSKMAMDNNALNFGQGFPNWTVPDIILDSLKNQIHKNDLDNHLYSFGSKFLLEAIQDEYSPLLNQNLQWDQNIIISAGATSILGYIFMSSKPSDEIIVMEPFFPWYQTPFELFKGVVKFVRIKEQPDNSLDVNFDEIASLCNEKTKYIIINSPQNPSGKLFNEQHFEALKKILDKHKNIVILSDEVYERVVFNKKPFPRLANYKDLWNRTISIFSGGKTYSCTGWRVGWAIGPANLIEPLKELQRITNNHTIGVLMNAMAQSIIDSNKPYKGYATYYEYLSEIFNENKKLLIDIFNKSKLEFHVIEPEGGHFIIVGIRKSITKMPLKYFYEEGSNTDENKLKTFDDWRMLENTHFAPDEAFCAYLTKEYKITPIPCSAFYFKSDDKNKNDDEIYSYIRFAICKAKEDIILLDKYLNSN